MKKRIKAASCPNCGNALQPLDNYCPICGQENDNKRQSFGRVMADLVQGFLSIDSRLTNSLPALFFRPGFLTREFMNGRRQRYLDPVRMFITIVVIYFIFASFGQNNFIPKDVNLPNDSIVQTLQTPGDTIIFREGPFKITLDNKSVPNSTGDSMVTNSDDLELDVAYYSQINEMVKRGKTDTREIMDSLKIENTFWNRFYYGEIIKFASVDFSQFREFLVSKLPWFIFFLMPVFALLLKLIYIRKNFLYIDHLIFAFHLHSFFFMAGIVYLLVLGITGLSIEGWLVIAALVYILLAFKNFYLQSWSKTILKLFILLILYAFTAVYCFILSLVIIFIMF